MRFVSTIGFALFVLLLPGRALGADFNVSMGTDSGGVFRWVINGQISPTLTLTPGTTYTFAVSAPGHPFDIKTAQVTGTADQFPGVTGQGTTSGTLTFAVPQNPPSELFYQCEVHSTMTGPIMFTTAGPTTPAMGTVATWGLLLALSVAGFAMLRRPSSSA
jgi:hypothetical protein